MELPDIRMLLAAWLALPLTALDWWVAWDKLPARVVMKFGPNGQPIHWAPRDAAMRFDLTLVGGTLAFMTLIGLLASYAQPERARSISAALLACAALIFAIVNGVLWAYQVP